MMMLNDQDENLALLSDAFIMCSHIYEIVILSPHFLRLSYSYTGVIFEL